MQFECFAQPAVHGNIHAPSVTPAFAGVTARRWNSLEMTFPDRPFPDIAQYCGAYFKRLAAAAESVDRSRLAEAAELLGAAYRDGRTVFVCGNGGLAAIAGTFVPDHVKLVRSDTDLIPRVVSLADNMSMITAIANDMGYAEVFAYQLSTQARDGDLLTVISASGDSENVVRAARWALEAGMSVIAMTGFSGGRLRDMATISLHVEADNYGIIEDTHQSLMHLLAQFIRQAHMDPGLIAKRRF